MKAGLFDHRVGNAEPVETHAQRLDYLLRFWAEDEREPDARHPALTPWERRVMALERAGLPRSEVAGALRITGSAVDNAMRSALRKVRIPRGKCA